MRINTNIKVRNILAIEHEGGKPARSIIWYRDRNGQRKEHSVHGFVLRAECGEYTDNLVYEVRDE